jgi:hypothetical protein
MAVRLSALCAGRPLLPRKISGTHFDPQDYSAVGRIRYIVKKKIHLIGTRSRDLPACNTVPQPTTLPRTPFANSNYFQSCLEFRTHKHQLFKPHTQSRFSLITSKEHEMKKYCSEPNRKTGVFRHGLKHLPRSIILVIEKNYSKIQKRNGPGLYLGESTSRGIPSATPHFFFFFFFCWTELQVDNKKSDTF